MVCSGKSDDSHVDGQVTMYVEWLLSAATTEASRDTGWSVSYRNMARSEVEGHSDLGSDVKAAMTTVSFQIGILCLLDYVCAGSCIKTCCAADGRPFNQQAEEMVSTFCGSERVLDPGVFAAAPYLITGVESLVNHVD